MDHCVIVIVMVFPQWVHLEGDIIQLNIPIFDPPMRESVCKKVLFSLPDALVRIFLSVGVHSSVVKTRYPSVLAHPEVLRSSKVDWSQLGYPGWYSCDYCFADVCELLPTHCGGRIYPCSKPRARVGLRVVHLFDIKTMFDEKKKLAKARLEETLNVVSEKPSREDCWRRI